MHDHGGCWCTLVAQTGQQSSTSAGQQLSIFLQKGAALQADEIVAATTALLQQQYAIIDSVVEHAQAALAAHTQPAVHNANGTTTVVSQANTSAVDAALQECLEMLRTGRLPCPRLHRIACFCRRLHLLVAWCSDMLDRMVFMHAEPLLHHSSPL